MTQTINLTNANSFKLAKVLIDGSREAELLNINDYISGDEVILPEPEPDKTFAIIVDIVD